MGSLRDPWDEPAANGTAGPPNHDSHEVTVQLDAVQIGDVQQLGDVQELGTSG
ncbi:hypothetical protein [Streptomyces sp. NPDC054794]